MDKTLRQRLVIPFIVFIVMIGVDANSLLKGIAQHENWRIIIASISGLGFLTALVIVLLKSKNTSQSAEEK